MLVYSAVCTFNSAGNYLFIDPCVYTLMSTHTLKKNVWNVEIQFNKIRSDILEYIFCETNKLVSGL